MGRERFVELLLGAPVVEVPPHLKMNGDKLVLGDRGDPNPEAEASTNGKHKERPIPESSHSLRPQ